MTEPRKMPREIMMRAISGPTRLRAVLEGYGVIVQEIERELTANGWEIVSKPIPPHKVDYQNKPHG